MYVTWTVVAWTNFLAQLCLIWIFFKLGRAETRPTELPRETQKMINDMTCSVERLQSCDEDTQFVGMLLSKRNQATVERGTTEIGLDVLNNSSIGSDVLNASSLLVEECDPDAPELAVFGQSRASERAEQEARIKRGEGDQKEKNPGRSFMLDKANSKDLRIQILGQFMKSGLETSRREYTASLLGSVSQHDEDEAKSAMNNYSPLNNAIQEGDL